MMKSAFELSEQLQEPVVLRIVTRPAHSRAAVEIREADEMTQLGVCTDRWVLLPGIARARYDVLVRKQQDMLAAAEASIYNRVEAREDAPIGIIACGIGYNYVKEAMNDKVNVLKVSQYPLPEKAILELSRRCGSILVVEDGQPVVEQTVKMLLGSAYPVKDA